MPAGLGLRASIPWPDMSAKGTASTGSVVLMGLVVSAAVHFACFARWPGAPDWDVHHSVFAARNFVENGQLLSINLYPDHDANLARHAQLRWMTHWPPGHSWLFATAMTAGLSAGGATKALGLLCVLFGGLGYACLTRALGGSRFAATTVAIAYPWLSMVARLYIDYKNDHLAAAVAPWVFLAMMRLEPSGESGMRQWSRIWLAGGLAGATVLVKYSLMPVIVASALYFIWLDGHLLTRTRLLRLTAFLAALLLPGVLLWLANQAWTEASYPLRPGTGLTLSPVVYANNLIANTIGSATGWDLVLIQLNLRLGMPFFKGVIAVVSLFVMVIWAGQFVRTGFVGREKRFAIYLSALTLTLWVMLGIMTLVSGAGIDYSSMNRFYIPVGFGWLVLCCLSLDKLTRASLVRSPALYSLALPVAFSTLFFAGTGLIGTPPPPTPTTHIGWSASGDTAHAAVLANLVAERGRKPDLLVALSGEHMTELGVPCLFTYRATRDHGLTYYSRRELEVWAMVLPEEEEGLLANFSAASHAEKVPTPPGFPFVMHIFRFVPNTSRVIPPIYRPRTAPAQLIAISRH